jgi:hypothetical protein
MIRRRCEFDYILRAVGCQDFEYWHDASALLLSLKELSNVTNVYMRSNRALVLTSKFDFESLLTRFTLDILGAFKPDTPFTFTFLHLRGVSVYP